MRYPVAREVIRVNPDGDMPRGADAFGIDAGAHLVPVKKRTSVKERRALASPQAAADYLKGLAESPVERFVVVPVDQKNRPLGAVIASQGALNEAVVGMREVFAPAVEARAAAIIVAHNHPSGDSTPSQEDVRLTERLMDAGRLLGIPVLDHLVIGDRVTSLRSIAPAMFSGRPEARVAERRGRYAVRKKRNPTARQRRDLSSWKAQARLQAAAMSDWELNERAPAFLRHWVPSMRSRARRAAAALRQVRSANPRRRTKNNPPDYEAAAEFARKMAALHSVKPRPITKMYGLYPTDAQLKEHSARILDWNRAYRAASKGHKSAMTQNPRRAVRRRNPWPAFLNGVAGGAGFFAANTALGALRTNGKRRRRRSR